jgi:putative methyltransferase
LALLLLHDHLLTKGGIATSTGPLKLAVLNHKARLSAELKRALLRRGHSTVASLKAATEEKSASRIPRWVRVNTLKSSFYDVISRLSEYTIVADLKEVLEAGSSMKLYYCDPFVADLLAFPPSTDLTTSVLYKEGKIILQDRSSCLPAFLLNPPTHTTCIDATAAPGNKTTHLAAILSGSGKVIAFEKDHRRSEILRTMVTKAGGDKCITIYPGADFLRSDPDSKNLREATHLLLDPSCSGSGIVGREEYTLITPAPTPPSIGKKKRKRGSKRSETKPATVATKDGAAAPGEEEEKEEDANSDTSQMRLLALAEFQSNMIQHAMLFPAARKISYSTCSIHAEENEDVVSAVLASKVAQRRGWRVETREEGTLKDWPRRGLNGRGLTEKEAEGCIRCNPVEDGGIGFFVVAFVRDGSVDGEAADEDGQCERGVGETAGAYEGEEEWRGFSDDEPAMAKVATRKKNKKRKK